MSECAVGIYLRIPPHFSAPLSLALLDEAATADFKFPFAPHRLFLSASVHTAATTIHRATVRQLSIYNISFSRVVFAAAAAIAATVQSSMSCRVTD